MRHVGISMYVGTMYVKHFSLAVSSEICDGLIELKMQLDVKLSSIKKKLSSIQKNVSKCSIWTCTIQRFVCFVNLSIISSILLLSS